MIGGIGSIEGPIIGTFIFFWIRNYLPNYEFAQSISAEFEVWSVIILGAVAIGMMLIAPNGLWGLLTRYLPLELFPVRRLLAPHLRMPSNNPPNNQN